jgi:hypothetical protein
VYPHFGADQPVFEGALGQKVACQEVQKTAEVRTGRAKLYRPTSKENRDRALPRSSDLRFLAIRSILYCHTSTRSIPSERNGAKGVISRLLATVSNALPVPRGKLSDRFSPILNSVSAPKINAGGRFGAMDGTNVMVPFGTSGGKSEKQATESFNLS